MYVLQSLNLQCISSFLFIPRFLPVRDLKGVNLQVEWRFHLAGGRQSDRATYYRAFGTYHWHLREKEGGWGEGEKKTLEKDEIKSAES